MGRILLICRLAVRDLRKRPGEAALLLLTIAAASTTLTLGLVLHGVTEEPYRSTRAATAGPDVIASRSAQHVGTDRVDPAGLRKLGRICRFRRLWLSETLKLQRFAKPQAENRATNRGGGATSSPQLGGGPGSSRSVCSRRGS